MGEIERSYALLTEITKTQNRLTFLSAKSDDDAWKLAQEYLTRNPEQVFLSLDSMEFGFNAAASGLGRVRGDQLL